MADPGFVERGSDVAEGLKPSGFRANLGGGPGGEATFMSIVRKINNNKN